MEEKRGVEHEFGVPIPGQILDPSLWTKTALKKLPAEGMLDPKMIFGREAPLVVDLGCGNGRFVLGSALRHPDWDHLAIDILPMVLRYATRRANQRGLANLRFAACDAERLIEHLLPTNGAKEVHCYHPQPFHDPKDAGRRLIRPSFLVHLYRVLEPGGKFFFQTDHRPYWSYTQLVAPHFLEFHEQKGPWPETPEGRTRRELMAKKTKGLKIYRGWGTKRADRTTEELMEVAKALAGPDFE